jgi:hypothetical protein
METPSPQEAAREAIRHWHNLPQLAEFAVLRHGYLNTDMGFGVTYPDDLDEYARVVECEHIPDGFVRVNGFEGPPDGYEVLVEEREYLRTLVSALMAAGHLPEAARVRELIR